MKKHDPRLGEHRSTVNRRRLLQAGAGAVAAAAVGPRITFAQDSTPAASPAASPAAIASPVGTVDENGFYPSGTPGVPDAYTKMPAPFASTDGVPGSGGKVTAMVMIYGAPPPSKEENQYWQGLDERLGVSWEPILVPNSSYGEKATAIIASGDMPDMFYLNYNQTLSPLAKFTQQGAFLDLTPYVTGDALQEYPNLASFPDFMWEATKLDGKIYGVPCPSGRAGQVPAFRTDWGKKFLGGKPTTSQELHDFLVAVSKDDPDGNGSADTWGMGRYETYWDMSLIYPMFRVPNSWRVNDDGSFVKDVETDEFRMAVEFLATQFKDGAFHPDSAAMQYEQALQLFTSGRVSLHADGGSIHGKGGFLETVRQYQPEATMEKLIPFGHDGGDGVTNNLPGIFGFTAIPSTVTDEERIRELLRIFNWLSAPFGSEEWLYKSYGTEGTHFDYNENGFPVANDLYAQENGGLTAYIGGNLLVNVNAEQPELGPLGTDEGNAIIALGIDNPAANLFSPEQIDKGPTLSQIVGDGLTDIITGRSDMSKWDQIVNDWRSRGGDAVRGEYEAAYAANQG
jgi:putative aldouronate transport system substrate-binding protein